MNSARAHKNSSAIRKGTVGLAAAGLAAVGLLGVAGVTSGATSAAAAESGSVGTIVSQGSVAAGSFNPAELSGLTLANGHYLTVNDKTLNDSKDFSTSVLQMPESEFANGAKFTADTGLPNIKLQKAESITTTPDGKYVIASTAYNKYDPATGDKVTFNGTVAWPANKPADAKVIGSTPEKPKASLGIRGAIQKALPGDPGYIKVEGTAATSNEILFGIRQYGASEDSAAFGVTVVAMPYTESESGITVDTAGAHVVYSMNDATKGQAPLKGIGLSDLYYNSATGGLDILASYENEAGSPQIAGYMFTVSKEQFAAGTGADIVKTADGNVIQFSDKTEGITKMPNGNFLIVSDNDDYPIGTPGQSDFYQVQLLNK